MVTLKYSLQRRLGVSLLSPILLLALLVLGVQFTFLGAEGNPRAAVHVYKFFFFSCLGSFLLKLLFASSFQKHRKDLSFLDLFLIIFLFEELGEDMMHGAKILKIRCKKLFQRGHITVSVAKLP